MVTSRMSAIVQAIPNANATFERRAALDAHNEAMAVELAAEVARLNARVAHGLSRLDALRSTDAQRIDREVTSRLIDGASPKR